MPSKEEMSRRDLSARIEEDHGDQEIVTGFELGTQRSGGRETLQSESENQDSQRNYHNIIHD